MLSFSILFKDLLSSFRGNENNSSESQNHRTGANHERREIWAQVGK